MTTKPKQPLTHDRIKAALLRSRRNGEPSDVVLKRLKAWNQRQPKENQFSPWALEQWVADANEASMQELLHMGSNDAREEHEAAASGPGASAISIKREGFWQASNQFFHAKLGMPPLYLLVWLCLQYHANHPDRHRQVEKQSHPMIAEQCNVDPRTVAWAIRYLRWVRMIRVESQGGTRRGGHRDTSVYRVPPLIAADLVRLKAAIPQATARLQRLRGMR